MLKLVKKKTIDYLLRYLLKHLSLFNLFFTTFRDLKIELLKDTGQLTFEILNKLERVGNQIVFSVTTHSFCQLYKKFDYNYQWKII